MAITGNDLLEKSKKKKKENEAVSGEDLINRLKTYQSTDTTGVDQKYIDSFMKDANTFLTTAEKDYGGLGWANASSSYESRNTSWQDLDTRANAIGAWLFKNGSNLDGEVYKTLSDSLSSIRGSGSSIMDSFKSAVDYYSQWKSEDEYNKWYEEDQKRKAMASSAEAQQGWDKYLADLETSEKAKDEESFWEKIGRYLSEGGGVADTTLPMGTTTAAINAVSNDYSYMKPNDNWSDEQKKIFGYLYQTSPSDAYKYATTTNNLNKKVAEEEALKKIAESATSNFWAGAGHTIGAIASAPLALGDYLSDLVNMYTGRPITSDGIVSPFEYSQAVTGGISTHLNDMSGTLNENIPVIGGKGLGDLYGLGTSIAQSMASAYTMGSTGTLISYFGQGAASGVDEALSRGASDGQALLYGTSLGVFEGLAEMIGVDNLFKLGSTSTVKGFIRNIVKQAGAEGMEEGLTAFLSNIADNVIMGDKSNFSFLVAQYMADGMSEDEAQKKAWVTTAGDMVFDTIAGAVSGGVSGGIHTSAQTIASNAYAKNLYGNGADLVNEALDIDANNSFAQKMKAKVDNGKNLSGGQINRLVESNEQTLLAQDTAKMKSAVEARLNALGETGDISELADVIVKARSGEKLTSAERSILTESKYGRRVSTEMNPDMMATGEYTSAWAENIGTERINYDAYNKELLALANETAGVVEKTPVAKASTATPTNAPTEKETATETKYKVSEDGKARLGDTEVSIKEIASIKNGEVILRLDDGSKDGSTVKASEVTFSSNEEGLLYENVVDMGLNAVTANTFVKGFDGSIPVGDYVQGFKNAYRYGELGISKKELSSDEFASRLTDSVKSLAYNHGSINAKYKATEQEKVNKSRPKADGKVKTTNRQKYEKKGEIHNTDIKKSDAYKSLSDVQKVGVDGMTAIYKALGIDVYFFESPTDAKGNRTGKNGYFVPEDGSVHIDLYAGIEGKGTILFTAGHELTHYIREKLPLQFKAFADILFDKLGQKSSVAELIAKKKSDLENLGRITPDMSEQEAYDLAYEETVADACESMLADGKAFAEIAQKVKAKNKSLWETIKQFFTNLVAKIKKAYEGLNPDSVVGNQVAEMLETVEELRSMWVDMLVEASEVSNIVEVDADTKSVAPMFSERTWTASEYVIEKEKTAKAIAKALNVDLNTAYKYIDDINSIARLIADDRARLDYDPNLDEKATVLKPNSDYKYTVDMSTLCAKRLLFTGTFDAIQRALPNMVFDSEDIVALREMMQKRGYEVACGICYVESTRREIGRITQEFIDSYKEAQKTGKPITRLNSEGKSVELKKTKEQKETTADKSTDKFYADKDYTPTLADLNTTDIDLVKRDHPLVYEAYLNFMNARGQAKPKLLETRAEYKGEILKHFKYKSAVNARNNAGGLRLQSFSDFEVPHLIDMMQIVMDMARVGLKSQAYTKVPAFAEVFGNTGVKINLSLIAKGDGLDANGNLIFDDVEGINHKEAFKLRDKYSKNVGTILVGKTDAHIIAAMADPRIDYIIPFHKSSWKESLYDALGLTGYADYTDTQHEKPIDKSRKISDYDPSEYWDFTKSGDENAQIYLEKCREDGRIPKFPQFQGYPGYWKLLIDFKMYDNDGVGSPQEVVQPNFNMEASEKILREYKGGHKSFPVAKDVVEDFVKEHKDNIKYSDREVAEISSADYREMYDHFGATKNYDVAGYMLQNGVMLDFSGKHWGDDYSTSRQVDHRDIQETLDDRGNNGINAMIDMIGNGNIRLMPEVGGINLAVKPNDTQMSTLRGYINHFRGEVVIDIDKVGGDTIHSWEYTRGTSSAKILADIKAYFDEGIVPKQKAEGETDIRQFLYSDRVTDKKTLDFLNKQLENGEVTEVYRAMATDEDRNLYPPMAGYVRKNGKKVINGDPSVIGEWEQSTESIPWESVDEEFLIENGFKSFDKPTKDYPNGRFERDNLIFYKNKAGEWKAKFHLDKDNGSTVDAAYAPYIHTSLSVLNDQFTSAYTRDNLVVVRGYVPNSEVNGVEGKRYQANFADKPVGKTKWHSGVVAAQMPETRTVILSRYFMPIEIVDESVVAQKTKEMMKGKDIEIPYNVVTPRQRKAMEAIGIRIGEARGLRDAPKKADVKYSDRVLMGSLFSGGGTLEAGLVYQMLDKEFAVEYNKKIASTYTDNHGKEHMFVGDVRDFNSKEKQSVFYLHASPVCKNFSPASHSGGETTLDITTAEATARVLEEQMPQVFTVENVKRYIGSEAYNIITNKLDELGYTWDVEVYKASDYGNATKRERMIIRAVKSRELPAKPQKASSITSWGEATRDLWETDLIPSNLVKSKIEAIKNTPKLKGVKLTKLDKPLMIYDTTKSKTINFAWADELAPTLTTKCGDARIIMPDGRVYAPTPKFMGRIQGLPDDYKYPQAKTRAFTIIGNGIPTQLTKAVIGGVLDSAYEQTHDGKVLYSDRNNVGYHAGDLGKAEYYPIQGYDRDTGHFGTGTYFVGNEEKISGGYTYGNRPHHAVDFSDYNLYKVKSDQDGWELHDQLRVIDGGISQEWLTAAKNNQFMLVGMTDVYDLAEERFGDDKYTEEARISAILELAEKHGIELLSNEEFSKKHDIPLDDEYFTSYYLDDYLERAFKEEAEKINSAYRAFEKAYFNLWLRFGMDKTDRALQKVLSHQQEIDPDSHRTPYNEKQKNADSLATVFMKALGYEGIDVRGTRLDNTTYGSVIYDLKEDTVLWQDRSTESFSNRTLLANALESVAQNDIERNKLAEYKSKIALIESEQAKLAEIRAKIKELSFAKRENRDDEAKRKLQFEEKQTANRINTYDRQLLNLESTKALKGVLEREKQMAYKRAEQKGKEALKEQREKDRERNAKTQRELLTRYQESRKKGIESRHKTEMRYKIKKVVNELNQYLKGTKEKHVPIQLQRPVAEALRVVNMDTVGAEQRISHKRELMRIAAAKGDMDKVTKLAKEIDHIQEMGENLEAKLARLQTAYDSILQSDDPLVQNAHDAVISNTIAKVIEVVGDTPVRDMSLYQLEAVYDMYKMVLSNIRKANKAHASEKSEEISTIANGVIAELKDKKRKSPYTTKAGQVMSAFDWNNLKPVYAFERIGSLNLDKVFNRVLDAEGVWATDMSEAEAFRIEQQEKYNFKSWDFEKKYEFFTKTGERFELNLNEIMALYAWAKDEDAKTHLFGDGFQFDPHKEVVKKTKAGIKVTYNFEDATSYKLSQETLDEIIGVLDEVKGAKEFADAMQDYLANTMGEKGNEVSLALYEIKLFKNKVYFPLKVSHEYLAVAKEKAEGKVRVKNKGFTNERKKNAKNTVILSSFMDVWTDHVHEMSMYHAFTLPLEDFRRVIGYSTPSVSDDTSAVSVRGELINAHGKASAQYIDQLFDDINGGAKGDPRETLSKSLVSRFKKASVVASLSVTAQQPTAIVRAMALVNPKHFGGKRVNKGKIKEKWETMKKYAPVCIIKEMGGFDTGMSMGAVAWLKGEKTFMDKVDDALGLAPEFADKVTWIAIWNAVERETVHNHKDLAPNSEAFLNAVGERFTEVIRKTQVYDSTLARSANMRSKGLFMTMLTSFMAEPTTSINMLLDAFRKIKSNPKYFARTLGAVYGSVVLNSAIVSLIYAMRDDDEDETYLEKYVSRFVTEVVDGVNPLTYIPGVKDVWSIAQGFDVERADMSLVTKVFDSLQQVVKVTSKDTSDMDEEELDEHYKAVAEAWLSVGDNITSLFGLPVKNIRRDINGIINLFKTLGRDQETTAGSLGDNIAEDLKDSIPVWGWLPDKSKGDKLYDAIKDGDKDYVDRMKEYYEYEHFYTAVVEEGPVMAQAVKAVIIQAKVDEGKTLEEAEESFVNGVTSYIKNRFEEGDLSYNEAADILINFCGKSAEEADIKVQYWEFKRENPDTYVDDSWISEYYADGVADAGISIEMFVDYRNGVKGIEADKDNNGNTISGSRKAKVMAVINSMPISNAQKDALYFAEGWAASRLWEAPWH